MKSLALTTFAIATVTLIGATSFASDLGNKQNQSVPAQKNYTQSKQIPVSVDATASAKLNGKKHRKNTHDVKNKVEESQTKS